jgi:hypothetical protein
MISIVGDIRCDESNPERIKYLIACIRSYSFLKDHCQFILNLDSSSDEVWRKVGKELLEYPRKILSRTNGRKYGKNYTALLQLTQYDYVINFMEDHFMVCDRVGDIFGTINLMKNYGVEVCKASFWMVEQNSTDKINTLYDDHHGYRVFLNTKTNFDLYQQYYKTRYYIGCNFLTTREFAIRFWNRDLGERPHPYEVAKFDENWLHCAMVPGIELQAAIDDDHGESNTCLLKRNDCEKWNKIWKEIYADIKANRKEQVL